MSIAVDRRHLDPFAPPPPVSAALPTAETGRVIPVGVDRLSAADLRQAALERGVDPDGTRVELIARLRAWRDGAL